MSVSAGSTEDPKQMSCGGGIVWWPTLPPVTFKSSSFFFLITDIVIGTNAADVENGVQKPAEDEPAGSSGALAPVILMTVTCRPLRTKPPP